MDTVDIRQGRFGIFPKINNQSFWSHKKYIKLYEYIQYIYLRNLVRNEGLFSTLQ